MDGMVEPLALIQREASHPGLHSHCLHILRGGGTSDNLDQFSGNDSLSGTVEQNLVLADHLTGVLGGVLRELSALGHSLRHS